MIQITTTLESDFNVVALYVNNVRVSSIHPEGNYSLENYSCSNDEMITFDDFDNSVNISNFNFKTSCSIYLNNNSTNFAYTGNEKDWIVPTTGTYRLEVWGASGGNATYTTPIIEV